jgi:large subunit ribosomal protein L22
MTGAKTNERPGVRAQHRYARLSAYKAREVLDLIRGKSVAEARSILEFTERGAAHEIGKVLDSAIANAGANNDIPPEELFVSACFADEGPTLRRFRPRARGRASRIRKRTTHITVIVGRYSATELERLRARNVGRRGAPADAATSRARRVARSRQRAAATQEPTEETVVDEVTDTDADIETVEAVEAEAVETESIDEATDADMETADEADDATEATAEAADDDATTDSGEAGNDTADDDTGSAEGSESKDA